MKRQFEFQSISKKQYYGLQFLNVVISLLLPTALSIVFHYPIILLGFPLFLLIGYFFIRRKHKRDTLARLDESGIEIIWSVKGTFKAKARIKWQEVKDFRYVQTHHYDQFRIRHKNGDQTRVHFSGFYEHEQLTAFLERFEHLAQKLTQQDEQTTIKKLKSFDDKVLPYFYPVWLAFSILFPTWAYFTDKEFDRTGLLVLFSQGVIFLTIAIFRIINKKRVSEGEHTH